MTQSRQDIETVDSFDLDDQKLAIDIKKFKSPRRSIAASLVGRALGMESVRTVRFFTFKLENTLSLK